VRDTNPSSPEEYGSSFRPEELADIPSGDLPAGLPEWMGSEDGWAFRTAVDGSQRWGLAVTVPPAFRHVEATPS
jgi:uracil-DNA glycosylase